MTAKQNKEMFLSHLTLVRDAIFVTVHGKAFEEYQSRLFTNIQQEIKEHPSAFFMSKTLRKWNYGTPPDDRVKDKAKSVLENRLDSAWSECLKHERKIRNAVAKVHTLTKWNGRDAIEIQLPCGTEYITTLEAIHSAIGRVKRMFPVN